MLLFIKLEELTDEKIANEASRSKSKNAAQIETHLNRYVFKSFNVF